MEEIKGKFCPICGGIFADSLKLQPSLAGVLGKLPNGQERPVVCRDPVDKTICPKCRRFVNSDAGQVQRSVERYMVSTPGAVVDGRFYNSSAR